MIEMSDVINYPPLNESKSFYADIYVGGDISTAKNICRSYCFDGFCVNIQPATFIYKGGEEEGVKVGIVNYPRFPESPEKLTSRAEELGRLLMIGLYQQSFLVQTPNNVLWYSRRDHV